MVKRNVAAFYEFVDDNFLHNKRPPVPGGAWPLESLRRKSLADLQTIWFTLLKERNKLSTMKEHYLRHQEELGALPAPSRIKMVDDSMKNIKQVVKERDAEATAQATKTFKERMQKGIYRSPPGPSAPVKDSTSVVKVLMSHRVDETILRELFGRYDEFETHRGIVSILIGLPEEVLTRKKEAEQLWSQYMTERSDTREYLKWEKLGVSLYDYSEVELAASVTTTDLARMEEEKTQPDSSTESSAIPGVLVAANLSVPSPLREPPPSLSPLERIKRERKSVLNRSVIQLGYFPNITLERPRYSSEAEIPRPTHPDEIEGPWEVVITYDREDGFEFANSLGITNIGKSKVLEIHAVPVAPKLASDVDSVYREAVWHEKADEENQMKWPHVPEWKYEYDLYTKKHLSEVARYNYSNVVDYVDREVLLTGRSSWELPIEVDPTCGGARSVPAHAKRPKRYMNAGIGEVGVTDI